MVMMIHVLVSDCLHFELEPRSGTNNNPITVSAQEPPRLYSVNVRY